MQMLGRPATPPTTPPSASFRNLSPCPAFRNLGPDLLAGVIFTCTDDSFDNCIEAGVFGLPRNHFQYVQYVRASMVLFLFNYNTRELHGIFRAVTQGKLDGRPGKVDSRWAANFPAQVFVDTSDRYPPLPEAAFKLAIMDNYHSNSSSQFAFELDTVQVARISELFKKFNSSSRYSPSPQLSPLAQSPTPPPVVNTFPFMEGGIGGGRSSATLWDGLAQSGWNPGEPNPPPSQQQWEPPLTGQNATVAALNAQLTQDLGVGYNPRSSQHSNNAHMWQMAGTPVASPTAGSLSGLGAWATSPVHPDASPRSQVWANLGGPLSPVVALTPRASTPGGSTTPTGVWGQQTIWSARPGDPFGGLSWSAGQAPAPGVGVGLSLSDSTTNVAAGLSETEPTPVDPTVDRRGWGSLLDGSGGLVELKASEGGSEAVAKNADKLMTFGSLVAKEEDLEALLEAEEEGESGEAQGMMYDAARGYEPFVNPPEHDQVAHGWSNVAEANKSNGHPSRDAEPGPLEDKMLERISSLPRIKTGRDANGTNDLSQVIAAVNEINGELPPGGEPRTGTGSTIPRAPERGSHPGGQGGVVSGKQAVSPSPCQPVKNRVPPGIPMKQRESSIPGPGGKEQSEKNVTDPEGRGDELVAGTKKELVDGSTAEKLEIYSKAIDNLTNEVKSLRHENAELRKDRDSIKAELERTQMRLFLMRDRSGNGEVYVSQEEDQPARENQKHDAEVANISRSDDDQAIRDLWVVGGVTDTQKVCRKLDVFQPTTDLWVDGPKLPMGLCYGAAVAHGPYMFVLGGVETNEPYSERAQMWNINLVDGAISDAPSLMGPRTKLGAVKVGSQIYAIGGLSNSRTLRTVEIYDPMHDCWLPGPPLKHPRRAFGTAVVDGNVYVVGGIDKNNVVKSMEMMDPREGQWQVVGNLDEPRAALACAPMRGNLMVVGGYSEGQVLATAEILDVRARSTVAVPDMKQGRSYCTATAIGNEIFVVGGRISKSDDDSTMAEMERFNIDNMTWVQHLATGQPEPRGFHAACAVKREV